MNNPHMKKLDDIEKEYRTNSKLGLSDAQVAEHQAKYGLNQLKGKKQKSLVQRFFEQFKDIMVLILIIAAAVSFFVALKGHDTKEYIEPVVILSIVILNAVLGVVQENKAERSLEALQNLSSPRAKVIRNGKLTEIEASQIVPGDLIEFEAGDFIPADGRLVDAASLKIEESALTGESVPVEKDQNATVNEDAPLGDRVNMVFSGSSVSYGRGKAIIIGTGMDTQMGKIAELLESADQGQTPLQQKLGKLGKYLGLLALAISIVIFAIGFFSGMPILEIFMTAVSLAVAAIPEGLPAIVTVVLALGVQRMVKRNAIIRRLPAVETLGSASVICSDKTGTLTQNKMTVIKAWVKGEPEDITDHVSGPIKSLLRLGSLASNGTVEIVDGEEKHIGDPTETAILSAALKNQMTKESLHEAAPRVGEIPFDSDRKLMTTIHVIEGKPYALTKGAFDVLMNRCKTGDFEAAKRINNQMTDEAMRVIAVAYKELDSVPDHPNSDEIEHDLHFVGLLGMIDPPRAEAKDAVQVCKRAGIRPVMITGDHIGTANAIAKELGILNAGQKSLSGAELEKMSDQALNDSIDEYSVYARVSPEDKIRIVRAWQQKGAIVSMTGDGVNDAPALKAADIGCAMGITGTDVAKGASDMILTDDNFATIVDAVKEGRGTYDNIRKAIQFLLGTNMGEIFIVFIAMIIWQQTPLLAIHLLWLNLVTDGLPALALGMEPVEEDIMKRRPKPKAEGIFAGGLLYRIVLQGLMFAVLSLIGFYLAGVNLNSLGAAQTMAFLVLSLSQLFHVLNVRTTKSIFQSDIRENKYMILALLASLLLIVAIVFIPPLAYIFEVTPLPSEYYLIALGLGFVPIIVIEIEKLIRRTKTT
ncbi:calcium-translocating P-type ATPase, PMCA-type [Bacillus sp. D386]|uniref:calcium-translocating P-type ATPase, PMCA-type n=1 Tax=Bacillus sp. D386 TaxID=2587155 RepID=UPI001C59307D|nr:calcium-translocating P-type ATPase, PMCA-type [Bacillus sp. D386]